MLLLHPPSNQKAFILRFRLLAGLLQYITGNPFLIEKLLLYLPAALYLAAAFQIIDGVSSVIYITILLYITDRFIYNLRIIIPAKLRSKLLFCPITPCPLSSGTV